MPDKGTGSKNSVYREKPGIVLSGFSLNLLNGRQMSGWNGDRNEGTGAFSRCGLDTEFAFKKLYAAGHIAGAHAFLYRFGVETHAVVFHDQGDLVVGAGKLYEDFVGFGVFQAILQ